jgi:hypothetical protein
MTKVDVFAHTLQRDVEPTFLAFTTFVMPRLDRGIQA